MGNNFDIGIHLDVYGPVWIKFGMMRDTMKLHSILVLSDLDLTQGHRAVGQ